MLPSMSQHIEALGIKDHMPHNISYCDYNGDLFGDCKGMDYNDSVPLSGMRVAFNAGSSLVTASPSEAIFNTDQLDTLISIVKMSTPENDDMNPNEIDQLCTNSPIYNQTDDPIMTDADMDIASNHILVIEASLRIP